MYELIQISDSSYYIQSPAKIGHTHSNADHIGGNKYLQGQTGCKIYVPGIDCDFTRHPILEPSFLYGGILARISDTSFCWRRKAIRSI